MAKVVLFEQYGPPEVLKTVETADPIPQHGEIRIRVMAAGVQPFDCATRRGDFAAYRPLELPSRLGNEVAGVVDEVGPGDTHIRVGDEVIAYLDMTGYANLVVVSSDNVVAKPVSMPWPAAGALSVSGQTASTALDALEVTDSDVLLVHAAAGGVGSMAVQLAVGRGATVVGTSSATNHNYLRKLGAIPVTYGPGLPDRVRAAFRGPVTASLDAIGGDALDDSMELVESSARIVTIADWERAGELGIRRVGTDRRPERLEHLTHLYAEGQLRVEIAQTFGLDEASAAHRAVETGHVRGKVVLVS